MAAVRPSRSPRKSPRRRLAPDARRAELLAIALSVFARRGIGEARHAQVADAAGCSVSTVFVYFPTRRELVDGVLGEVERHLTEMAEGIHASVGSVPDIVRDHVTVFADSVDTHPDHARVWLDWSTAIREQYWRRYIEFQERIVGLIASTLQRGQREGSVSVAIDPNDEARLVVGCAHMIVQMKLSGHPPAKVERFAATVIDTALGNVR